MDKRNQPHTFFLPTFNALEAVEQPVKAMNFVQVKGQVLDDLHLKDILENLRGELIKQPKPTIGELAQILSQKILECTIAKHRASMQTVFDFGTIDFKTYF